MKIIILFPGQKQGGVADKPVLPLFSFFFATTFSSSSQNVERIEEMFVSFLATTYYNFKSISANFYIFQCHRNIWAAEKDEGMSFKKKQDYSHM